MFLTSNPFTAARVTRGAAASPANFHATTKKHSNWPAASKPAFYAAFYAVDKATGGSIG
jgi:hypothetical protein